MASIFEVFPRKIIAMVAVPFVLGLMLLLLLFELGPTAFAIVVIAVLALLGFLALVVARVLLAEKEQHASEELLGSEE